MKGENKLTAALADAVFTTSRRCHDDPGRSANAEADDVARTKRNIGIVAANVHVSVHALQK